MRIDKYLKVSRVIKRRTIAKDILDLGFVKINDKVAKPSTEVKENDIIELTLGERRLSVKVLGLSEQTKKKEASSLFEVIADEQISL
ncbi:MAG: RNA-binding S4 domain-containing protein [Bacillales bacterium]|nr:RNA-binding S4 domain-containing protein [Bacillales bacterium]MDY3890305.1 RNA-binding S4 domain-containing protein [Bacilli bacterium]